MSLTCEDLATKAELQELRDQINALLGEKEDGSGSVDVLSQGSLAGTAVGVGAGLGLTAIQDLTIEGGTAETLYKGLADGTAKVFKTVGNGAKTAVNGLGGLLTTAGKNAKGTIAGAQLGAVNAQTLATSVSLIASIGTLALQIASIQILGNRIDQNADAIFAWNNDYTSIMNQLSKTNQDIEQAIANIDAANVEITNANETINTLENDLTEANTAISTLQTEFTNQKQTITELQATSQSLRDTVDNNQAEAVEARQAMYQNIDYLDDQLGNAFTTISLMETEITKLNDHIAGLEARLFVLSERLFRVELTNTINRAQMVELQLDLQEQLDLQDARVTNLEAQLVVAKDNVRVRGGGGALSATNAAANGQTKTLELMNTLSGANIETPTITSTDIQNNTTTFNDTFANLLTQIQAWVGGTVNAQDMEDLRTNLGSDFENILNGALGLSVIPALGLIQNQTSRNNVASGVEQGICQSLNNPASCAGTGATQGLKGLQNWMGNNLNAINTGLSGYNATLNSVMLPIVQSTNNAVKHASYGLEATKNFMDKAWDTLQVDKALNAINTALLFHNAFALSNNVAQTIGDVASVTLNAMGIKDKENNPIDVNSVIRSKLDSVLNSILGSANYAALRANFARANRIYQSGVNVLDATRSLFDSARAVAETTAENTGKIGNALKSSGAVLENSYSTMTERLTPLNPAQRQFERFRQGLETIEQGASTLGQISSEIVETQENYTNLKQNWEQWETEKQAIADELEATKQQNKTNSQGAQPEANDYTPDSLNS